MVDLEGKCKDTHYDDSYSKEEIIIFDLYPWEWSKDSETAVDSLCSIVTLTENTKLAKTELRKTFLEIYMHTDEF